MAEQVHTPFYQVKVAGVVVVHTNRREEAHTLLRTAAAKPAELWRINEGGSADLLERVPA